MVNSVFLSYIMDAICLIPRTMRLANTVPWIVTDQKLQNTTLDTGLFKRGTAHA